LAQSAASQAVPKVKMPSESDKTNANIRNAAVAVDENGKAVLYVNYPTEVTTEWDNQKYYQDSGNQVKVELTGVKPEDIKSVKLEVADDGKITAKVTLKDGTEKSFDVEKPKAATSNILPATGLNLPGATTTNPVNKKPGTGWFEKDPETGMVRNPDGKDYYDTADSTCGAGCNT
jgi:hypothetical protein